MSSTDALIHEDIEAKLVDVVRDNAWDGDVNVYPDEDIPESKEVQVAVLLDYLSNGALRSELDDFFEGHTYQNTVLFVAPKQEIRSDDDIISKAARVLGAENLQGKVEDEQGELGKIIRDERRFDIGRYSDVTIYDLLRDRRPSGTVHPRSSLCTL
ncbi:hypothetical protein [Halomicrococcus sp. SG-WS-1]|uniref:hypothetical protein n=1 Tax=Halomicrococcus sp. SG-WS-1 TaxID=3439057 RepID=UPI003F7918B0